MKMRKFADKGIVREGKNKNIDDETRARAMASVAGLSKPKPSAGAVAVPGRGGPVAVPGRGGPVAVPGRGGPVAAGTLTKPPIITKEQMEKEGFTDLRDYLNFKGGFTRRPDKVNPDMRAKADAAPAAVPVASSEEKNTSNDLRAKSKEQQARGARLRGETDSVLGENAQKLKADFKRSLGVKHFLESSDFAKGGSVSSRADGIAQRGKTRGKMC
jgi:hypothetical protein